MNILFLSIVSKLDPLQSMTVACTGNQRRVIEEKNNAKQKQKVTAGINEWDDVVVKAFQKQKMVLPYLLFQVQT